MKSGADTETIRGNYLSFLSCTPIHMTEDEINILSRQNNRKSFFPRYLFNGIDLFVTFTSNVMFEFKHFESEEKYPVLDHTGIIRNKNWLLKVSVRQVGLSACSRSAPVYSYSGPTFACKLSTAPSFTAQLKRINLRESTEQILFNNNNKFLRRALPYFIDSKTRYFIFLYRRL